MSDLKLLTERMVEKKKNEVQEKVNHVELEVKEALDTAKKEIDLDKKQQQVTIDARLKAQYEQDKNALQIHKRDQLLSQKQLFLTNTFKEAELLMEQWSPTQFQDFLLNVLSHYSTGEQVELIVGEKSLSKVSTQWIEELSKTGVQVQLSEQIIPKKAGFVLKNNGIEYNYCFDELFEDIKGKIVSDVSKKLFA